MFILDHNFWTRNARKSIKGSKDSDSSLVSNENFSETLWPSGWALDQATLASMNPKLLHLWRHSQKIDTPNQKFFSSAIYKTVRSLLALEQLSSAIGGGAMALVRQLKTCFLGQNRSTNISYAGSQSVNGFVQTWLKFCAVFRAMLLCKFFWLYVCRVLHDLFIATRLLNFMCRITWCFFENDFMCYFYQYKLSPVEQRFALFEHLHKVVVSWTRIRKVMWM